jgi:hypothetical protein
MPPRPTQSNQQARTAKRQRISKTMLLPVPRKDSDSLSLQNHLALCALGARQGSAFGLRILLQMVVMTGFIDEARSQEIQPELLVEAEERISEAFSRGEEHAQWFLDGRALALCHSLITWHDGQLRTAPLILLENATERLERLRTSDLPIGRANR